jgi:hypothetical protein
MILPLHDLARSRKPICHHIIATFLPLAILPILLLSQRLQSHPFFTIATPPVIRNYLYEISKTTRIATALILPNPPEAIHQPVKPRLT